MSTNTTNYALVKPGVNDQYDVGVQNSNMDILDGVLKKIENKYFVDAQASDAYAITIPNVTAYTQLIGVFFYVKVNTTNTGDCTLNVNALGAKSIVRGVSGALTTGDILANQIIEVVYDGTNFQLKSIVAPEAAKKYPETILVTASRALAPSDAGNNLNCASASEIVITIPLNATVAMPLNTEIGAFRSGAGVVRFAKESASITLIILDAAKLAIKSGGTVVLVQVSANVWVLAGALE